MDLNDLIQWITVGVIMAIAVIVIVRKVRGFRRSINGEAPPQCGCGCSGCAKSCDLRKEAGKRGVKGKKQV